jgi:hypothetical protein
VTYDGRLADRISVLRRVAPWVVAAVVVALLLVRYSPSAIAHAVMDGDAVAALPWGALVAAVSLGVMSVADWLVFEASLGARMGLGAVVRGRAATAMLSALHVGASGVGYGVWLARRSGAGAGASVGALFYQMIADLCAVLCFALGAALLGGELIADEVRGAVVVTASVGAVVLSAALAIGARALPRRIAESAAAGAWRRVGVGRFAASMALRIASLGVNVGGTWAAARAFGLELPWWAMAVGLPVTYLVTALPVNVAGLGAVSAAWVALFERWAPGAEILAFQFVWQLVTMAMLVARGLPFLPSVTRDIAQDDQ